MLLGARDQRTQYRIDPGDRALHRTAHPHAEIGRDLIVAAACGVQAPGGGADDFGQPRFHGHVDVFEVPVLGHSVALVFGGDLLQAVVDRLGIGFAHDALFRQHGDMRAAARDILAPQRFVEGDRGVDFGA